MAALGPLSRWSHAAEASNIGSIHSTSLVLMHTFILSAWPLCTFELNPVSRRQSKWQQMNLEREVEALAGFFPQGTSWWKSQLRVPSLSGASCLNKLLAPPCVGRWSRDAVTAQDKPAPAQEFTVCGACWADSSLDRKWASGRAGESRNCELGHTAFS